MHGHRYAAIQEFNATTATKIEPVWCHQETTATKQPGVVYTGEATALFIADGTINNKTGEANFIVVYCTAQNTIIALDGESGRVKWRQNHTFSAIGWTGPNVCRGLTSFNNLQKDATSSCRVTLFSPSLSYKIFAIDAATGEFCEDFGEDGVVDLCPYQYNCPKTLNGRTLISTQTPPAILNGVILIGSAIGDDFYQQSVGGAVLAFNATTGKFLWKFDAVPRNSSDPAYSTWAQGTEKIGNGNVWSFMSSDEELGLFFIPTSSPSTDAYGGFREGDNLYTDSIVALEWESGKVRWHYQLIKHDLWDYDIPSQPVIANVTTESGKVVKSILSLTKTGFLFILDATTGEPVYPVAQVPVPPSTVEKVPATQPIPQKGRLGTLLPQIWNTSMAWGKTEEARAGCLARVARFRGWSHGQLYSPPSFDGWVHVPSMRGGGNWGSVAVDEKRQIAVFKMLNYAELGLLIKREDSFGDWCTYTAPMFGTPYKRCYRNLNSPVDNLPCIKPPWCTIIALDLTTGEFLWEKPFGKTKGQPAEYGATLNRGGQLITQGGLVFAAGATDSTFYIYDLLSGKLLKSLELPDSAFATPMAYQYNGVNYVLLNSDYKLIAYALTDSPLNKPWDQFCTEN